MVGAAPGWLAPRGSLLFETSETQAEPAVRLVETAGLVPRVVTDDGLGATVVVGSRA